LLLGEYIFSDNEGNAKINIPIPETMVLDVIEYAKEAHKEETVRYNSIVLIAISSIFLLSIFVCLICNYAINKTFNWSLYPVGGEVVAWLIISPFFLLKKHRYITAMVGLTISLLPFLLLIEYLSPAKNWVIPFAMPIVIISLFSLWVTVLLFSYTKINTYYLLAFDFILFGVLGNLAINYFVSGYLNTTNNAISNTLIAISAAFASIVLVVVGFNRKSI